MVTEWLMYLGSLMGEWALGLLPTTDAPDWFRTLGSQFNTLLTGADGLGVWVGWGTVVTILLACVSIYLVLLIVKVAMKVWSFVPFVGGTG